jgi:hypothetical protein
LSVILREEGVKAVTQRSIVIGQNMKVHRKMRSDETNLSAIPAAGSTITVQSGGKLKGQRQQKQTEQELEEYHKDLT